MRYSEIMTAVSATDHEPITDFLRNMDEALEGHLAPPAIGAPLSPSQQARVGRFLRIASPTVYRQILPGIEVQQQNQGEL